jgi:hypothetical protein
MGGREAEGWRRARQPQGWAWLIALVLVMLVGPPTFIGMGASVVVGALMRLTTYAIVFAMFRWRTQGIAEAVLGPEPRNAGEPRT